MMSVDQSNQLMNPFQACFNKVDIAELFKRYQQMNFIYPAKQKLLSPYLETVRYNWEAIYRKQEELLWVITSDQACSDFSTVCLWRYSRHGMQAQHLVSSGNPFLSLKMMLAAQYKAECMTTDVSGEQSIQSGQNWFRPDNRYAYRVFASMYERLGPEKAFIRRFKYQHLSVRDIPGDEADRKNERWCLREVTVPEKALSEFVMGQCGEVFLRAEELDQGDLTLSDLSRTYLKYGAIRLRKVFLVEEIASGRVLATVLLNRAPTGLNFSFLENRLVYLLSPKISNEDRHQMVLFLNHHMKSDYADFEPGVLPIVTDELTANILKTVGAVPFKDYVQTIWLRDGFRQWFEHIQSFLNRIESKGQAALI